MHQASLVYLVKRRTRNAKTIGSNPMVGSMKFNIPKLNIQYKILRDIEIGLWHLDQSSWDKVHQQKLNVDKITLNSGAIIKITNWNYKHKRVKIRIVSLADKRYEKLCGYVSNPNNKEWFDELEVEEIPV